MNTMSYTNVVDLSQVIGAGSDKILEFLNDSQNVADTIEKLFPSKSAAFKLKLVESVFDKMLVTQKKEIS